ncbi:MAG: F0F1 ATP synthase subunit B [Clostridiales bacterium]|nr:F0F1 ATP synthase subunit B [Clostridiales bacterium]
MVQALGMSLTEFIFYLVNFLILVGVLGKFLYKPFLNLMETRKQSIVDALDNAEAVNRRADEKMANYDRKIAKLEAEGREIIKEAKIKAEEQANEIIEQANQRASQIMNRAEKEIEREREKAVLEMREQIAVLSLMAAEKIMERDVEVNGQDQIIEQVLEEAGASEWQN